MAQPQLKTPGPALTLLSVWTGLVHPGNAACSLHFPDRHTNADPLLSGQCSWYWKAKTTPTEEKEQEISWLFFPIIGIMQLHQKHFLGNLSVVSSHAFSVSARILLFLQITYSGTHTSTASSVSRVEKRALECQCLAVRIPFILTRLHLLKKWSSVSLHIMSGHNWQYYGN